ncbi:MAG: uL4 family ribosomal protein [Candidatus Nanoarchaeia archaeon]
MKAKLIDKTGKAIKDIELPKNFSVKPRKDIIKKVVRIEELSSRQIYGAKPGAGSQYSASGKLKHRRHKWKTTYGRGISRIPRKMFSVHGNSFNWEGATIPGTRGGRKAHAPRAERNLSRKVNKKELRKAFDSAFSITINKEWLKENNIEGIIFTSEIFKLNTKDLMKLIKKIFPEKAFNKKRRAGKGKRRGRQYKINKVLLITGSNEGRGIKMLDVKPVSELFVGDIVPNGNNRFVAYTENAIKEIGEKFR